MRRLYISYAPPDQDVALQLARAIRNQLDSVQIAASHPGRTPDDIAQQISQCHIFIYLVSHPALDHPRWQFELNEAMRQRKTAQPIEIEPVDGLVPMLGRLHPINMSDGITAQRITDLQESLSLVDSAFFRRVKRKNRTWLQLIVLLGLAAIIGGVFFISQQDTPENNNTVTDFQQRETVFTFRVLRPAVDLKISDGDWLNVVSSATLGNGDALKTDQEGRVQMFSVTGQRIDIQANTELILDHFQSFQNGSNQITITLLRGYLENQTTDTNDLRFTIQTPTADIQGQKAHCFITVNSDGNTLVVVESGIVEVSTESQKVSVPTGFQLLITPTGNSQLSQLATSTPFPTTTVTEVSND